MWRMRLAKALLQECRRQRRMKGVFSRKGWDSGYDFRPSPGFPDSTIQSLPIEDSVHSSPRIEAATPRTLKTHGFSNLATFLDRYYPRFSRSSSVHHDPDLHRDAFNREQGWLMDSKQLRAFRIGSCEGALELFPSAYFRLLIRLESCH